MIRDLDALKARPDTPYNTLILAVIISDHLRAKRAAKVGEPSGIPQRSAHAWTSFLAPIDISPPLESAPVCAGVRSASSAEV
jgi:hypothetical protein